MLQLRTPHKLSSSYFPVRHIVWLNPCWPCLICRLSAYTHLHIWKCQKHGPKIELNLCHVHVTHSVGPAVCCEAVAVSVSVSHLFSHSVSVGFCFIDVPRLAACSLSDQNTFGPIGSRWPTDQPGGHPLMKTLFDI